MTPLSSKRGHDLERCQRIVNASYALHSTLELDELLRLIIEAAKSGVHADRGTVFLISEDGQELWSQVITGTDNLDIRLPVGQGIAGTVAQTGETVLLNDAQRDPRFDDSWDRRFGYVTKRLLTTPIRNRQGTVIGVFQLLNKRNADFDDEDEAFLAALSIHAALALENARLHRSALEKERQDREIALARQIQRTYLPERLHHRFGRLDVAGLNLLHEHASGDYYDLVELGDGRLLLTVGDVAGHGLGAALVMAQARAFLRAFTATGSDLPTVMNLLNDHLARDNLHDRFMSLFVAIIDPMTGAMQWNNGGHPPALLLHRESSRIERLLPQSRVLGAFCDAGFCAAPVRMLDAEDALLLYTDGATEASSRAGEAFGEAQLATLFAELGDQRAGAILDHVLDALVRWTGLDSFADDLTLLVVKCDAGSNSAAHGPSRRQSV